MPSKARRAAGIDKKKKIFRLTENKWLRQNMWIALSYTTTITLYHLAASDMKRGYLWSSEYKGKKMLIMEGNKK